MSKGCYFQTSFTAAAKLTSKPLTFRSLTCKSPVQQSHLMHVSNRLRHVARPELLDGPGCEDVHLVLGQAPCRRIGDGVANHRDAHVHAIRTTDSWPAGYEDNPGQAIHARERGTLRPRCAALRGVRQARVLPHGRKCPVHAAPYVSYRIKTACGVELKPLAGGTPPAESSLQSMRMHSSEGPNISSWPLRGPGPRVTKISRKVSK